MSLCTTQELMADFLTLPGTYENTYENSHVLSLLLSLPISPIQSSWRIPGDPTSVGASQITWIILQAIQENIRRKVEIRVFSF